MKQLLFLIASALLFSVTACGQTAVREYIFNGGDEAGNKLASELGFNLLGYGKNYPKDQDTQCRLILLENSRIKYGLWLRGKISEGRFYSPVGMCFPSQANFHAKGFLKIMADQFDSTAVPFQVTCSTAPDNNSVSLSWRVPPVSCDAIFTLPENSDMLLLKISFADSSGKRNAYTVALICYPSSFGGGNKQGSELRKREAMTSKQILTVTAGEANRYVLSKDEAWVLFYDRYFDYAQNRGDGPCSIIFNPAKTLTAEVYLGYACQSLLTYPVNTDAEIILREFYRITNASAIKDMQSLTIKIAQ